ncbi:MAG: HD domain-containing phosphohydrolase [Solirubrobacteraceae bacterium]
MSPAPAEEARAAELVATLCLAADLGSGLPLEHGLHGALVAARIAERLGVDAPTARQTYYAALLNHAGCTTDAHVTPEVFGSPLITNLLPVVNGSRREVAAGLLRALPDPGGSPPARAWQTARRLPRMATEQRPHLSAMCEVAGMLAGGLGLPDATAGMLALASDRWDGHGPLRRARREEIPLAMRIMHVATDSVLQCMLGGPEHAARLARERAGAAFDPEVAACLADDADELLAVEEGASLWVAVLDAEPGPQHLLRGEEIDQALATVGAFADLVSPYLTGHAAAVAALAGDAAQRCGAAVDAVEVRRAGLVADVGRVTVGSEVWQRPGPLSPADWEEVRLHPYHGERVLSRAPRLAGLARLAGAHHERMDGSGYHRGSTGAALPLGARLLAAADVYAAMREPRPYRPSLTPADAVAQIAAEVDAGRLQADVAAAVVEAAGERPPSMSRPAGLTEREAQVIALAARGLQTKQIARALGISAKTADNHLQSAYRKAGVSSRAAATLFAMQHGLVAWGELPMA